MPKTAVCTLYHNPRCSKSRATLALLRERGVEPVVVEYLEVPPTAAELKAILRKLGMRPEQIARTGEAIYQSKFADRQLTDAKWIAVLAANPILIERPIVVLGERAVVGRPPENILQLLA